MRKSGGESFKIYTKMTKDVNNIYLTSGIRNVIKQLKLFMGKIERSNLNITKASFSIAPPAYSYHSISDFDVGKIGWGWENFTANFAKTKEFYKIRHLNYVGIRYRQYNRYGVRFEPWHIKVI
jgi:LAS superfamily LD-carboxypeptidase LdcB